MLQLVLYVGIAIGVSFLCSMMEATLLSVRMATLTDRARSGSRGARLMFDLKRHRIDDAISAILILNTVANTFGATLAGWKAAEVFGSAAVGMFSAALTLAILVFSEIVPKTLGTAYAFGLAAPFGFVLTGLTRLLWPVLLVSRALTRFLTRKAPPAFSRGELAAVIETAGREGALTREEHDLVVNLLRLREVRVEDVMTPRTVVAMLPADETAERLLDRPDAETFSRFPVWEDSTDNVIGYVLVRDVLAQIARGVPRDRPLRAFLRPVTFVPEVITVDRALKQMIERREPVAMVADEHGGVAGLVTLEDLTETLLGVEIVDESDRAVDMREVALDLRDRRLARMRHKRELSEGPGAIDPEAGEPAAGKLRGPID